MTRAAAFRQVEKMTGRVPAGQESPPPPPPCVIHVWDWFMGLVPVYAGVAVTPAMLAADIKARFGIRPSGFELKLCLKLFALWRQAQAEQEKDF